MTELVRDHAAAPVQRWWRAFASHDLIALAYGCIIFMLAFASPDSSTRVTCMLRSALSISAIVGGVLFARVLLPIPAVVRGHVYRLVLTWVVIDSYLMLRDLLPLVRSDSIDGTLLAIDYALFGVEPALWLERFNIRPVIEWFSFFYFSYFLICGGFLFAMLWIVKPGRHTSVFAVGSLLVMFVGQLGYMAAPGYGPVTHLAGAFAAPLDGGFWWNAVWETVQAASAVKDIFPSLHTAMPTWFTLFAFHCARSDKRWRPVAMVTGFFAFNIIISTMMLRWHYAIDVVAGLMLACFAAWAAPRIARLDRPERWVF